MYHKKKIPRRNQQQPKLPESKIQIESFKNSTHTNPVKSWRFSNSDSGLIIERPRWKISTKIPLIHHKSHYKTGCSISVVALSKFARHGEGLNTVLEEIVDALCRHISDDSPMVKRRCDFVYEDSCRYHLCILTHTKVILGVILARLDDSVQLTAVLCLLLILESSLMVWSMFYLTCLYRFTIFRDTNNATGAFT
nr:hypothetical protein [Tanacetum cinerariifolium]